MSTEAKMRKSCCCCFGAIDLCSMLEPHEYNGHSEIYSTMIAECFGLELADNQRTFSNDTADLNFQIKIGTEDIYKDLCVMCKVCVTHLRDAFRFKHQVENAYNRIQDLIFNYISSNVKVKLKPQADQIDVDDCLIGIKEESDINSTTYVNSKLEEKSVKKEITEIEDESIFSVISNSNAIFVDSINFRKNVGYKTKVKISKRKNKSSIVKSKHMFKDKKKIINNDEDHIDTKIPQNKSKKREKKAAQFQLDENDLDCKICGETFSWHRTLKQHMAVHFPNYICHVCSKAFLNSHGLRKHIRSHEDIDIVYTCDICNKTIKAKDNFKQHMKKHNNSARIFKCSHCPEEFNYFAQRNKHLIEVHEDKTKIYYCKFCTKECVSNSSLTKHVQAVHLKIRKYSCTLCGMKFYDKSQLDNHLPSHGGSKDFHCETCKKSYRRRKTLIAHMKIHSDEKCFECDVCGKKFTHRYLMNSHRKIHKKLNEEAKT